MSLTPKQEAFCLAYFETGNASEAYRRSYDAEKMAPATVNRKAKELTDNGKIAARMQELRQNAVKRNEITVDDLISELEEARTLGIQSGQVSASVSATMGKAKLLGFGLDKVSVTGPGGGPLQVLGGQIPADAIMALQERLKRVGLDKG